MFDVNFIDFISFVGTIKIMIKIYVSPTCSSCIKVKKWFDDQKIPYVEKNINGQGLSEKELKEMLEKSENGTDDIISKRSKIIKEGNVDVDSMSISELIQFIRKNPSVLKRPIIVDDHRIQVGYNPEEIRTFIPRAKIRSATCSMRWRVSGFRKSGFLVEQLLRGFDFFRGRKDIRKRILHAEGCIFARRIIMIWQYAHLFHAF